MKDKEERKGKGRKKEKQTQLTGTESSISREQYFLDLSSFVAVAEEGSMKNPLQKLQHISWTKLKVNRQACTKNAFQRKKQLNSYSKESRKMENMYVAPVKLLC